MSISDDSEKLNNCETCDQIKNIDNCSNYSSSDCDLTSFNEETNLDSLRLNFDEGKLVASRNSARNVAAVRQNKTFSAEKIREIERGNARLVDKILYHNRRPNQYKSATNILPKVTSSEINRRRHQEKISRENEVSGDFFL